MRTLVQILKMRNVILYIIQNFKDGVEFIKLFKILYFSQQAQLVRFGKVLINDDFIAQKYGAVPSYIYQALMAAQEDRNNPNFKDFLLGIEIRDGKVYASNEANMDYISKVDKSFLDDAIKKYKDINSQALLEMSHDEAWEASYERMQDDPEKNLISIIDIARCGKASKDMIDHIREKLLVVKAFS